MGIGSGHERGVASVMDGMGSRPEELGRAMRSGRATPSGRAMWSSRARTWSAVALALAASAPAQGQEATRWAAGAGVGGTYYCIITRCGTGVTVGGLGAYAPVPNLAVEAGVRWQDCFDCRRFWIVEGGLQARLSRSAWTPFVGAGVSLSSDPDFMGDQWGLYADLGTWVWPWDRWGFRAAVRGRQVGDGDHMGEVSILVGHRVPGRPGPA